MQNAMLQDHRRTPKRTSRDARSTESTTCRQKEIVAKHHARQSATTPNEHGQQFAHCLKREKTQRKPRQTRVLLAEEATTQTTKGTQPAA